MLAEESEFDRASDCEEVVGAVLVVAASGEGALAEVLYLTGDSFSRKSRRLGSRSRIGSLLSFGSPSLLEPQSQPIDDLELKCFTSRATFIKVEKERFEAYHLSLAE